MATASSGLMRHSDVPFCSLSTSTRTLFSRYLNPKRDSLSPTTVRLQDWRGLAEVFGFTQLDVDNFDLKHNPTVEIIGEWIRINPDVTIGQFIDALLQIERYDIIHSDDVQRVVDRDVAAYRTHLERLAAIPQDPIQVPSVDSTNGDDEFKNMIVGEVETGRKIYFDAFVCYTADDIDFVKEMLYNLENIHGLSLCLKDRNMVAGGAQNVLLAELIKSRCDKMLIVMSPAYHDSKECIFLTRFAQSLQPGADKRTLIPIKYKNCAIPDILRHVAMLDYTREDTRPWFWQRLASSLRTATPQTAILNPFPVGTGYPLMAPVSTTSDYTSQSYPWYSFDPPPPAAVPDRPSSPPTSEVQLHVEVMPMSSQFSVIQSLGSEDPDRTVSSPKRRSTRRQSMPAHTSTKLASFLKSKKR